MPSAARQTLFWKYAAYFTGLVSLLLVVSGTLGGYFAYQQSTTALNELQRAKAQFAADEIARFITRVQEAMQSTVAKFTGGAVDADDLRFELIGLLRHHPSITELHWIDANGIGQFAISRVAPDTAGAGRDWSNDPSFIGAREGTRYMSPVHFRRNTEPYLSLAARRNLVSPILVADVNLKFVWDVVSQFRTDPASVTYVVDADGRLVSHPDLALVLANTDLSVLPHVRRVLERNAGNSAASDSDSSMEGRPVFATAAPVEGARWTVITEQSREEALRPVYASLQRSAALVLLGVFGSVIASLLLARRMVRPIREIAASAREFGEGKLDRRIEVRTGDELEALGEQFNRMAKALQDTYAAQEARIAERTRELTLANEAKTRFLAAASHDLRQPMHALALFVGQLRSESSAHAAPVLVEKIERSVEALEDLLEALLDLSRLDVGAVVPRPKPMSLDELLSRLVTAFAPAAEAKGLALTLVRTSLWVRSDPMLLERIMLNLLSNAIRYTREGRVLVGCRRHADSVDIVVADTGVGISAQHLPNIFQEFFRGEAPPSPTTKGLGLGLAIVKRLAMLLHHDVRVESRLDHGSVFRVRVPRAAPEASECVRPLPVMRDLRGVRILVVDDEAAAREGMHGLLAQWGCEVTTAVGGDEAVELARSRRPNIVLCDLDLAAGESGVRVAERLRAEHGPSLACAFVTGLSGSERIAEAHASGHPVVHKPTKPASLRALIEHLLGSSREALAENAGVLSEGGR